jgi:hypothetical protein
MERLRSCKRLVLSLAYEPVAKRGIGRPNGSLGKAVKKKEHNLTAEGRKRIVEAVRRRWARQKKVS